MVTLALISAWCGLQWVVAWAPAAILAMLGGVLLYLAMHPKVKLTDESLWIGTREISWRSIERLDHTDWISPLVVYLTLDSGKRLRLLYPGDPDNNRALLMEIRRSAVGAMVDGHQYRDVADELVEQVRELTSEGRPRYRLVRSEDEAEIERLFQKLKTAGRLDKEE
jgi:hypothetical protein